MKDLEKESPELAKYISELENKVVSRFDILGETLNATIKKALKGYFEWQL